MTMTPIPLDAHPFAGPAVAMLDFAEIPAGFRALDALVKEAPVQVVRAGTIQPGHYLILFRGQVEPVQLAMERARLVASHAIVDQVLLADAEPRILQGIVESKTQPADPRRGDTALVLVTPTPPVMLVGLDQALKGAEVSLLGIRIADGLGGRALAVLWGETHDVQAALDLAQEAASRHAVQDVTSTVIPRADDELIDAVVGGTHFFGAWQG